tara:strand:- start:407 stop:607 length:201 start_codon:yes stop_codon:yes gene_type:complete
VKALFSLLDAIRESPRDESERRLRGSNPNFAERVGRHPEAISFLKSVGFVQEENGDEKSLNLPTAY